MQGSIQFSQGGRVGSAIVVIIRRRKRREVPLRRVELGLRRGKLIFVVIEERIQLRLLARRRIVDGPLHFRRYIPQLDINIDRHIQARRCSARPAARLEHSSPRPA